MKLEGSGDDNTNNETYKFTGSCFLVHHFLKDIPYSLDDNGLGSDFQGELGGEHFDYVIDSIELSKWFSREDNEAVTLLYYYGHFKPKSIDTRDVIPLLEEAMGATLQSFTGHFPQGFLTGIESLEFSIENLKEQYGEAPSCKLTEQSMSELQRGLPVHAGHCVLIPPECHKNPTVLRFQPLLLSYVKSGGVSCPYCGSSNIEGGFVEIESGQAWQKILCTDCKKEWNDIYLLDSIEEVT